MNPGALWELRDVSKRYGSVLANDRVSLRLLPGEIHGLLGENGSGKSTLIKMLAGADCPTTGEILKDGLPYPLACPRAAREAGIATVFQEFSLLHNLSVAENIFLGRLPTRDGLVQWKTVKIEASSTLDLLGIADLVKADSLVRDLSVAQQQLVEIAKAVSGNARTIILDEPTAALSDTEIARLHALLRRLRDAGHAVLYVSHRLAEVVSLIDVATVLKDGQRVAAPGDIPIEVDPIVTRMLGRAAADYFPEGSNALDEPSLSLSQVRARHGVHAATFTLRRGEVLGVAGVMGSGRTSLLHALFGLNKRVAGKVTLYGRDYEPRDTRDAIARGVGLVPENRKTDGLFSNLDAAANTTITILKEITRDGLLDSRLEQSRFESLAEDLQLPPDGRARSVETLSGGNQQKLVLGRWILLGSDVLLLDEPTQGIDVGARAALYGILRKLTEQGKSILLVSSDFEELIAISDRIAILRDGVIEGVWPASRFDEAALTMAVSADAHRSGFPMTHQSEEAWHGT